MMQTYSELCAEARAFFVQASTANMKTVEEFSALWLGTIEVCQKLAMGSSAHGLRLDRKDFQDDAWALIGETLKPFEMLEWVDRRKCGRYISEFVLKPDKFCEKVLRAHVDRRKGPRKPAPQAPAQAVVKEKVVYLPPLRKEVPDSVAVIVDLPNVTEPSGESSKPKLPVTHINWGGFSSVLRTYHGKTLPLSSATLCVSEHYYARHRMALAQAERFGFSVSKRNGQKGADTVVMCALIDAVFGPLLAGADRIPVITLVSGDMDFFGTVETLRKHVRSAGLELRLRIVSWQEKLHYLLESSAHEKLALESVANRIRC